MDALLAVLDDDVRVQPSLSGRPLLEGREAVHAWWDEVMCTTHSEVEVRPLEFELHGDCVLVRGYLRHRDGRTLSESQTFWLYEIRDGKVTRMEAYSSRAAALASCA